MKRYKKKVVYLVFLCILCFSVAANAVNENTLNETEKNDIPEQEEKTLSESMNLDTDVVILMLEKPFAIVSGEYRQIDENEKITPIIRDGRTFLPLRFTTESLGADVSWIEATNTAVVKLDGISVEFILDLNVYKVNGELFEIEAAPYLYQGRVLIPIRALSEAFNKHVDWYETGLITISNDESFDIDAQEFIRLFEVE